MLPMTQHLQNRSNAQYEYIRETDNGEPIPYCAHYHRQTNICDEFPAHYHEYIEIIYVLEGTFMASVSGQDYTISNRDLLLINSKEPHAFRRFPNGSYICLQFDPYILFSTSRTTFEAKYIMPFIMSCSSPQRVVRADELAKTNIGQLIEEAYWEYARREYGFELAVRSNISQVFLWFLRKWNSQGVNMGVTSTVRSEDISRLENVLTYIDENYMRQVSAEKMAKMCNMSYSYFSRFFKASIGKTFSEYITYVRVTEAEKLLVSSGMNISQIAMETGFSNASYFITQFKKHRNMTPKKFKQKLLIESNMHI